MAKDPEKRAEEREQQIRDRLNRAGGFASGAMKLLDSFFSTYQENPRPELFGRICSTIIDMNLMYLPEHRFGLAGGLAAVVALNPDLAPGWKKDHYALITSAEKLMPPIVDTGAFTTGHVEYLWVWWLVMRDEATLTRIIRLSHRPGSAGSMAQALMINHVNIPRIQEVLATEGNSWKAFHQQEVIDEEVHGVAALFIGHPNVFCVGRQPDGTIVVVTLDGSRPALCPDGVVCRAPTLEERKIYDQIVEDAEDP
jgi:hypothetical protein